MANLLVRGPDAQKTQELAHLIADLLLRFRQESSSSQRLRVLGPATAAVERIKKDYRFQILIKTTHRGELFEVLRKSLEELKARKVPLNRLSIDIDPLNLL
jgi:primosomal protein N' (replication factor Y)